MRFLRGRSIFLEWICKMSQQNPGPTLFFFFPFIHSMFDFETLTTSLFLGSIVFAFFFLWGNNAIGCTVKIPDNVPRVVGHLPFAGGLVALVKNYHRINDFLLQVSKAYDFKTWTISMPFQPPFIWTTDPKVLSTVWIFRMSPNNM